jgi:hypothetical protein
MPIRLISLLVLLWIAGCALTPPVKTLPPTDPVTARCVDLYSALDQVVAADGTTPSYPVRIAGFPYLRVNRFLASYRHWHLDQTQFAIWLGHLAKLDLEARAIELASLPKAKTAALTERFAATGNLQETLAHCSLELRNGDLARPERLALLRERAVVPPEYHLFNRIVGLYPLMALPVNYGIYRYHQETRQVFHQPLQTLPLQGQLHRFRPPEAIANTPSLAATSRDALGIPRLDRKQLEALFTAYAPVWEIDVAGDFDRPGAPFWQADGTPSADPHLPVVYRYPSYTRWQGYVLLQLNYVVWFSKRPRPSPFDLLGGALDGIIWRVTLDHNGAPLIYDGIHCCGCYHMFFPSKALGLRPQAKNLLEPPLVPQPAPALSPGTRIVVRIASGSHYIQRIYTDKAKGTPYAWRDYQALYAVPVEGDSRRSLFGPHGLVAGTERAERWLLWPMGIPSPGGMRERGHHATAFVGWRHFDDANLLEQLFEPTDIQP